MESMPGVTWEEVDGQPCLVVRFVGNLTGDAARLTLARVRDAMSGREDAVTMIWDAAEMTGYETEARTLWQADMAELKPRIVAIHLVASSALIRMGAAVVGMFVGAPIQAWPSLDAVRLGTPAEA